MKSDLKEIVIAGENTEELVVWAQWHSIWKQCGYPAKMMKVKFHGRIVTCTFTKLWNNITDN